MNLDEYFASLSGWRKARAYVLYVLIVLALTGVATGFFYMVAEASK